MSDDNSQHLSRRDLLKRVAAAGAGLGMARLGLPGEAVAAVPSGEDDAPPSLAASMSSPCYPCA